MKNFLNKIMRGVFTSSLLLLILSSCEDKLFNADDQFNVDDRINSDDHNGINAGDFLDDYLLYCTFEGDAIPGQPNKALPGVPSGDELKYQDGSGIIVFYAHQQKSIVVPSFPPGQGLQKIEFVSKPASSGGGLIEVKWSGQLSGHYLLDDDINDNLPGSYNGWERVAITSGTSDTLVYLEVFAWGFVTSIKDPSYDNYEQVTVFDIFQLQQGSLQDRWIPTSSQHTFIVTCNLQAQTFNLKLIREDGTTFGGYNAPFYEPYSPIRNPRFRLQVSSPGSDFPAGYSPYGYILDNASIRKITPISIPSPISDVAH